MSAPVVAVAANRRVISGISKFQFWNLAANVVFIVADVYNVRNAWLLLFLQAITVSIVEKRV